MKRGGYAYFVENPRIWEDLIVPHPVEMERQFMVVKTVRLPSIIEFNSDAPCKLNNEMNCQEGAIAMTTTATTANKPNAYFSFSEVPVVLNANQLAGVLNISLTNAYCLLRSENFPTLRIGRRLLVSRDNLLNWMNEHSLAS